MSSKRKLEEKKKRAAMRQEKFQQVRAEQVACRLLAKPYRKTPTNYELRRIKTRFEN
jgi:hypothetical protein